MSDWKKSIGDARKEITNENIDNYKVNLINEDESKLSSWPLQRCVAWETEIKGNKYILSEGSWYSVAFDFFKQVNDFYLTRVIDPHDLPTPSNSKIKESDYNLELSKSHKDKHLFDLGHANSSTKSIGKDQNEVCDVYDPLNRTFIHTKMGKTSPAISHLLRQGAYSGHILKQHEASRNEFINHLVDYGCKNNIISDPYVPSDYNILFALVIGKTQKKDMPFFSKVSFRDVAENTLELIGYKCNLVYVVCP